MRLFVTGFNSSLVKVIISNLSNIDIIPISSSTNSESNKMKFDIGSLKNFNSEDYILHCAWNMKERNKEKSHQINVDGSINFFNSLNLNQKKNFIFVSTISAIPNTLSIYGKHKLKVEDYVLSNQGKVLRLGLLHDNNNNDGLGFISDLRSVANYFPIIPNFSGNSKIYRISTKNEISKYFDSDLSKKSNNLYLAYTEKAYSFKELLNDILGINKPVIRFPFRVGYLIIKLVRKVSPTYKLNDDSFLYIKSMKENIPHNE
tara:strand:+ start:1836 stop:2615 length:780 start_codon:yes stop_codon:yes gene_type:complete